jgi:peptide deformylase
MRLIYYRIFYLSNYIFYCIIKINPGSVAGTNLQILIFPNDKLRAQNAEITEFDDNLAQLAKEMFLVMYAARGIGLAAPQVGINKRLLVFNEKGSPSQKMFERVFINPKILHMSHDTAVDTEGCLSFPGTEGDVVRSLRLHVEYSDMRGEKRKMRLSGYAARIFQHEYDHLDGVSEFCYVCFVSEYNSPTDLTDHSNYSYFLVIGFAD